MASAFAPNGSCEARWSRLRTTCLAGTHTRLLIRNLNPASVAVMENSDALLSTPSAVVDDGTDAVAQIEDAEEAMVRVGVAWLRELREGRILNRLLDTEPEELYHYAAGNSGAVLAICRRSSSRDSGLCYRPICCATTSSCRRPN